MTESTKKQYLDEVLPERKSLGYSDSGLYYDRFSKKIYHYCDFDQELKMVDAKTVLKKYSHCLDSSEIDFLSKDVWTAPKLNFWLVTASRSYLFVSSFITSVVITIFLLAGAVKFEAGMLLIFLAAPASAVSCFKTDD